MPETEQRDFQAELERNIDQVLEILESSAAAGQEVDPLATILARLKARGSEMDLSQMPPIMRMMLQGMDG